MSKQLVLKLIRKDSILPSSKQDHIKKFDDPAMIFESQSEEEHELSNQNLDKTCARFGQDPRHLQDYPLNVAIWSQFKSDCSRPSFWLTKDHEDCKQDGDEQKLPEDAIFDTVSTTIENMD